MSRSAKLLGLVMGAAIVILLHRSSPGFSYILGLLFLGAWFNSLRPVANAPTIVLPRFIGPPQPTLTRVIDGLILTTKAGPVLLRFGPNADLEGYFAIVDYHGPGLLNTNCPVYRSEELKSLQLSELVLEGAAPTRATWTNDGGAVCALIGTPLSLDDVCTQQPVEAWVGPISLAPEPDPGRLIDRLHALNAVLTWDQTPETSAFLERTRVTLYFDSMTLSAPRRR